MYVINSYDLYESYSEDFLEEGIRTRLRRLLGRKPKESASSPVKEISIKSKGSSSKGDKESRGSLFIRAREFEKEMEKKHGKGSQAHIEASARTQRIINSEFELWVDELINEGYDLSDYTWDDVYDLYETYDDYITVIEYLLDEGYVEDSDLAEEMIMYMSDDWLNDIVESKK